MAGIDSASTRYAFVSESTIGTTPTSPSFTTSHVPIVRTGSPTRLQQASQVAGGALLGDRLLTKPSELSMTNAPLSYGVYDPLLEALFQGSWSTNVLKDGKVEKGLTLEKSFLAGTGGTRQYLRDLGVRPINGKLACEAKGQVMLSMDMMGYTSADASTSALSGATYTDPTENNPFSAAVDMGTITLAGFTLDGVRSIEVNFAYDGIEGQDVQGTTLYGITSGACRVTAKIRTYVGPNFKAAYDAARQPGSQSGAALTWTMGSVTTKKYTLALLDTVISPADLDMSSATAFVDITLIGRYLAGSSAVMQLTRAVV